MPSIIIPSDRTTKQPVRCYCLNPDCRESSDKPRFEFTTEKTPVVCPKCGADQPQLVGVLALIHFLYPDKAGPIIGYGGIKYALACAPKRAYLATPTNNEAATGDIAFVNCPGCLREAIEKQLAPLHGYSLAAEQPKA